MRIILIISILFCIIEKGTSQIVALGNTGTSQTAYTNGVPNDNIYIWCGTTLGAAIGSLRATPPSGVGPFRFDWFFHDEATTSWSPFTTQNGTNSTISNLASDGYRVQIYDANLNLVGCYVAWVWNLNTQVTASSTLNACNANLVGTVNTNSNFTYYNPPPPVALVSASTTIRVCFTANHTYVSDLGFYLIGPPDCGSPIIPLCVNPGQAEPGNEVCNNGDNILNFCFSTLSNTNINICTATTPLSGNYGSYGQAATPINWTPLYGCNAASGGWAVQIYDCIDQDFGALTTAGISFQNLPISCGSPSTINYTSGTINSAINDNSCAANVASIFQVPVSNTITSPITVNANTTIVWTSSPVLAIANATSNLATTASNLGAGPTTFTLTATTTFGGVSCPSPATTITTVPSATISYSSSSFCSNASDPLPTIVGAQGGTFTASPNTLQINSSTGLIDLSASPLTDYVITYTTPGTCPKTTTTNLSIVSLPIVNPISEQSVCAGTPVALIDFEGSPGSTFTWTNTNAAIGIPVNGTGDIASYTAPIVATSQTGTITVTPSLGSCTGNPRTLTITINPSPDPSFSYPVTTYCPTEGDPVATIIGTAGGNFTSSPNTLILNASTGEIDLSASPFGNYIVSYNLSGSCATSQTANITIAENPSVDAVTAQSKCSGTAFDAIDFTGAVGTSFNWTNSNTAVGLAASGSNDIASFTGTNASLQTATITVTPSAGTCTGNPVNFILTLNPIQSASFLYPSNAYCASESDPSPTITGNTGGIFSSTPAGISMNVNTGVIDLSASTFTSYTITYTNQGLCTSSSTFNVSISAVPSVDAVSSQTICSGENIDAIDFTGALGSIFNWANSNTGIGLPASGNNDIAGFVGQVSAFQTSTITVTPSAGGCTGAARTFNLTINPIQNSTFSYSNAGFCSGDADPSPTLFGNAGGVFSSSPAGAVINTSSGVVDLSASTNQTYTISYTNSGTCPTTSSISLSIADVPTVDPISNQVFCSGSLSDEIVITGSAGASLQWQNSNTSIGIPASGSGSIAPYTPTLAIQEIGTVTVTPVLGSCTGTSQSATITVNPLDDASFTIDDITLCASDPNPTTIITGITGIFTVSPNTGLDVNLNTGAIVNSTSTAGQYDLTYTTNGVCPNSTTVQVSIFDLPIVGAGLDTSICDHIPYLFQGTGALTYIWDNGIIDLQNDLLSPGTITYTVVGTDLNGCENSDQITINVLANPIAFFSLNDSIGNKDLLVNFVNESTNGIDYSWNFNNGTTTINTTSIDTIKQIYPVLGNFTAELIAINGICQDTFSISIYIKPYDPVIIEAPNVFSPNGDNINDLFWIKTTYAETMFVEIVNRWGNKIFTLEDLQTKWDGKVNGEDCSEGVYFYVYTIKGLDGDTVTGSGNLQILR
jgi:gliding motility-associated-like protein